MPGTVDNKLIYHLGVLIPFWVLQIICEILVIAFSALALSELILLTSDDNSYCYYDYYGNEYCNDAYYFDPAVLGVGYGAFGAALGLGAAFLLLHIIQIALFGRRKLTPAANFAFELTRIIVWLAALGLVAGGLGIGIYTIATAALTFALWVLYLGSFIYACVIFHRSRRGRYNGSYTGAYPSAYPQQSQMSYGPGPYQHPSQFQAPTQQQQPQHYQKPDQYGQPAQYQQVPQSMSPQPVHGQSMYSPPHSTQSPPP